MKGIGELGILESKKEVLKTPEIGIDSHEALKEYGKEMQGKVDRDAERVKKDTGTELNEVILNHTSSTNMPKSEIAELRLKSGVDRRIRESFGKVARSAAFAKEKIGQAAQLVTSKEL